MDDRREGPLLHVLNRIVVAVALVCFIGMLLATWAQVLFRKLAISIDWTEEAARVLFITSVFLGIAIAVHERRHIVVDFLFNKLSPRSRTILRIMFNLVILALLASLFRGAATMAVVTWESFMIAMNWLRTGYLYIGECIAIVLMMLYVALDLARHAKALRRREVERP